MDPLHQEQNGSDPESKNNWKWKKGVCRVESCSTRPGETEVGPCDVCHDCQDKFDDGKDPTLEKPINSTENKSLIDLFVEAKQAKDEQFTVAA